MSSHIISMHINLVSKLYASNLYAYWALQQAQSAHQPQAGYQPSSHEKLQAEQLTNPPGLNEDEHKAAKKAKTAKMHGMEKIVEETLQTTYKFMKGEMLKQREGMLKFLTQQESNPKPDLAVPVDVGIFSEYCELGGAYAASSKSIYSSISSSSEEGRRDEGLGKGKNGSSGDEGIQQLVHRAQAVVGTTPKSCAKPPSAIRKPTSASPADFRIRKERREEEFAEAERLGIPVQHALPKPSSAIPKPDYRTREERREDELYDRERAARGRDGSSGSSDKKEDAWPPSPSPPPSPPPPSNGCAAEKVAPKKKKREEKQGRDAHNPHSKPPHITINVDGKHIDNRGTSSQPAPTEGHQETPEDPRRQQRQRRNRPSKINLDDL